MSSTRDPDKPTAWLARAQSNLMLAESGGRGGVFLEDLCFEAQQASEKALYAVQTRYPGWDESVTEEEYLHVVNAARQVVAWAETVVLGSIG